MSLRSFARLGAGISIYSTARVGGTVKIDGYTSPSPSPTAADKAIEFQSVGTYVKELSSKLEVYVTASPSPFKSATFESDGGILHGSWNIESSIVTSDRRLKTNIVPLQRTLRDKYRDVTLRDVISLRADVNSAEKKVTTGKSQAASGDGALWLLRQLRPVSYSFRKGMDSKNMRFGFIADELESVVPEVVRKVGDREVSDQKGVVYQDLIALVASASQSQQTLIEQQQQRLLEIQQEQLEQKKQLELKLERAQLEQKQQLEAMLEELRSMKQAKQEEALAKKRKRYRKRKIKTSTTTTVQTNMTNESNTTNFTNSSEYQI